MEDNTVHRDKAAKLASTAKKLLSKSVSTSSAEILKGNAPLNLLYSRFLSLAKLGRTKGMKDSIELLKQNGNEYAYDYASMIFEAHREKYDNVMEFAQKLMDQRNFSINAFYYMGLALFKKGKMNEAKTLLEALNGVLRNNNIDALIFEINAQLSIY